MRSTRCIDGSGERELDSRVRREDKDRTGREQVRRRLCTTHDLQENGYRGRSEGGAVDEEVRAVLLGGGGERLEEVASGCMTTHEVEDKVDGVIYAACLCGPGLEECYQEGSSG